jgi:uncharacterized membrane protein
MLVGRYVMGVLYVVAGVGHFVVTRAYERIMPAYMPEHHALVLVSGVAEIAGGLGVMLPARYAWVRRAAAWGIVVLLVAVWPANLWMVQHPELFPGVPQWVGWLRLPLQVPLIWWAWSYADGERRSALG